MAKIHVNRKGETGECHAEKGGCPFGGIEAHYSSHEEGRKAFEANQDPFSGKLVAKVDQGAITSSIAQVQIDTHVKRSIEADLDDQHYDVLMSKKSISKLSAEQWQMLTYEQEAKVNAALAAFEEAQRKENYSMYEEGALDFNQLAISGDLANLRRYVEVRKAEADKSNSAYVQMSYKNDQASLERLEKVVKPGEEKQYVEEQAAKFSYVASFDDAVHLEREKHKILKSITEKSKRNSRTR